MLPRSTGDRMRREATAGKQSGRTQEIQRLIGRSLRAVVDLKALGERQITVGLRCDPGRWGNPDCLYHRRVCRAPPVRRKWMKARDMVGNDVLIDNVAAISCGIYKGEPVLDLDYAEDSVAETDANFVMTGSGGIVEIQGTAEAEPFSEEEFVKLMGLAKSGIAKLVDLQKMSG